MMHGVFKVENTFRNNTWTNDKEHKGKQLNKGERLHYDMTIIK